MVEIIYTCPICGHDLQEEVLISYPVQYQRICNHCGYTHTEYASDSTAVRIPFIGSTTPVDPCRFCSNHPSNGGSGICHCTLGTPVIY